MNKTEKVIQTITKDIGEGVLTPGHKLPSVRQASDDFAVSKNTIMEAYNCLVGKGMINAKPGSGYFVSEHQIITKNAKMQPPPQHVSYTSDQLSFLKSQLSQNYPIGVGYGGLPASWMYSSVQLNRHFIQPDVKHCCGYGCHFGYEELRKLIVSRNRLNKVQINVDQVVTTFGANHGLDLIIRRYLVPGDTVLVDDPGYYPLFAKLKFANIRIIGVRRTVNGPDLEDLAKKAWQENPVFFFTQSTGQNPTGSSTDLTTGHGILQIAERTGMIVVDDDPFVDLPNLPNHKENRLAVLDQFQSMIFVGTFSKTISAVLRSGYIIAPPKIAKEIAELKLITAVNTSMLSEIMITNMIKNRRYQMHLRKLTRRLCEARVVYMKRINELGMELFSIETHGFYSYVILPDGVSDIELAIEAAKLGIYIAPSSLFAVESNQKTPAIRINIARTGNVGFFTYLQQYLRK